MLRITASENLETRIFRLEGRLVGLWVKELERCWQEAARGTRRDSIRVELVAVTFIDIAGRELLRLMIRHGAQVVGADCLTNGIIDQLSAVAQCKMGSSVQGTAFTLAGVSHESECSD